MLGPEMAGWQNLQRNNVKYARVEYFRCRINIFPQNARLPNSENKIGLDFIII